MPAIDYEYLVRSAFGYKLNNGAMLGRFGDPACLANTDSFALNNINLVKAAICYSMEIFYVDLVNHQKIQNEAEDNRIVGFVNSVMNSSSLGTISELITDYNSSVLDVYYNYNKGIMTLK